MNWLVTIAEFIVNEILAVPAYLNYRKVTIYGGSSEVQRQIIDKEVLGL